MANGQKKLNMQLKSKITIGFIALILIPVFIGSGVCLGLLQYKLHSFAKEYHIQHPTYENLYDTSLMLSSMLDRHMKEIRRDNEKNPGMLEDKAYLNKLNQELEKDNIYLVVREDDQIYYNGNTGISDQDFMKALPVYGETSGEEEEIYLRTPGHLLVRQMDYVNDSEKRVSLFLVAEFAGKVPEIRDWLISLILIMILSLILTGLIVSRWLYFSLIDPIRQLRNGTRNIRDGNLDFEMESGSGIRELDELSEDFDEMRARLKNSEEEKLVTDKESKELISNISHDLKTPLTAIKGYASGILDGVADTPEKRRRYMQTVLNKANDMDRLLDELTLYSRIDTNKIPYSFTKLHVAEYFSDCVDEIGVELRTRGIELNYFNYLHDDAVIIADAEQLKRVVNNIIGNSVKYMDKEHGVINIRLRDVGGFVQAEIEDNGRGIPRKDVARIFDRFYRADPSRNNRVGGSGIGLSIVRKILEDHEGKVWATSKEGVGTVIYFVLRKYEEPPENEEEKDDEQDTDH